ncbi:hypothetical protein [Citrobacter farmeri]|uniref:hypothetical protein n=1 Tax=Citrobacter farmeri TaxID=67824 RepID=UPI003890BE5B|nr:hypothetical protein [Citrobacter farmeri]
MDTNLEFQKALLLLDHGKLDKGREILEFIIANAEKNNDIIMLVKSLVCLGDLFMELGKSEDAKLILNKALIYNKRGDDVLAYEFNRAIELLSLI